MSTRNSINPVLPSSVLIGAISVSLLASFAVPSNGHELRGHHQNLSILDIKTSHELFNTNWRAASIVYPNAPGLKPTLTDYPVTLSFTEDEVKGYAGCNQFTAELETVTSSSFQLDHAMMTSMWCARDGVMEQEDALGSAIFWQPILNYNIIDWDGKKTLNLYHPIVDEDGTVRDVKVAHLVQLEEPSLVGSKWQVNGFPNDLWITDTPITLYFETETTLSGYGGCNSFHGEWEDITPEDGPPMFRTKHLISTKMLCEEDISNQESKFMEALRQDAIAYSISSDWGGELTLYDTEVGNGDSNDAPYSAVHVGEALVQLSKISSSST